MTRRYASVRVQAPWAGIALALVACRGGAFVCEDDDSCAGAGVGGLCEPSGFCSLPDGACESGRRYGEHAGDGLAGECVPSGGTTSGDPTAVTSSTSIESLDGTATTTAMTSSAEATSTTESSATSESDATATTGSVGCPPGWWNCAWGYRMALGLVADMDPLESAAPVMVQLLPDRWDRTTARPDALDLRFIGPNGEELPYELERVAETTTVWLSWPAADFDPAGVTMYWGNPEAVDAQSPSGVWDGSHLAVWHLTDTHDSTGSLDLTDYGTLEVDGAMGGAREFDGQETQLRSPDGTSLGDLLAGDATIEAWIRPDSFGDDMGRGRIVDCANDSVPSAGWTLRVREEPPEPMGIQLEHARASIEEAFVVGDVVVEGAWTNVVVVWSDGQGVVYVNGTALDTTYWPGEGPPIDAAVTEVVIGRVSGTANGAFDGLIDEVRISNVARDAAWVQWQHRSAIDTVLVFGMTESLAS